MLRGILAHKHDLGASKDRHKLQLSVDHQNSKDSANANSPSPPCLDVDNNETPDHARITRNLPVTKRTCDVEKRHREQHANRIGHDAGGYFLPPPNHCAARPSEGLIDLSAGKYGDMRDAR